MDVLHKDLAPVYKLAQLGIKHSDADKCVKGYFNTIKKKPNAAKLGQAKITE